MKITVEFDSVEEFFTHFRATPAMTVSVEEFRQASNTPDSSKVAPEPEKPKKPAGKKRGPKPKPDPTPDPETVTPPSPSDDPVGDDLASVDAIRAQFAELVSNDYDAAEKLLDDLEVDQFDDLAEQGRLTELKTAMVERGLL